MRAAFTDLIDLASERLGGAAILANDEFFASKDNLVKPSPAIWIEGKYTDRGKWMDGWETRRRREPGAVSAVSAVSYDWCILRLGASGRRASIPCTGRRLGGAGLLGHPAQRSVGTFLLGAGADRRSGS